MPSFHRNKRKAMRNPPKGVSGGQIYSCKDQAQLDKLLKIKDKQSKLNDDHKTKDTGISK
ncbi:unnamed protein product [marine sediment metagenome]|uniref:Uncharacterized protein n=1 Tax=marine sediment metagenome TaxID=412755 RepID=X1QG32_9ZZZZ